MKPTAVVSTRRCQGVRAGSSKLGGRLLDALRLPLGQAQDLRDGVGDLGAGSRVVRQELEIVLARRVVRAQAEQARDDLGPEARRRPQARSDRGLVEERRLVAEAERAHEPRVELRHRHRARTGSHDRLRRLVGEIGDEVGELALRERVVRAEGRDAPRHEATRDDDPDLWLRPRSLRRRGGAPGAIARAPRRHASRARSRGRLTPRSSSVPPGAFSLSTVQIEITPEPSPKSALRS